MNQMSKEEDGIWEKWPTTWGLTSKSERQRTVGLWCLSQILSKNHIFNQITFLLKYESIVFKMQGQSSFTLCQYPVGNDIFKICSKEALTSILGNSLERLGFPETHRQKYTQKYRVSTPFEVVPYTLGLFSQHWLKHPPWI